MQGGRIGAAIRGRDLNQDVVRGRLGVFDLNIEIAVLVKGAGVGDFVFRLFLRPVTVRVDQLLVGIRPLRILIERALVGMRGQRIEKEVGLLHVLAMVAFRISQAEKTLLEDRVHAVPEGGRETEPALAVGEAKNPVLAPAISAAAGVIVRQVAPTIAVGRVILAHRAPLALGEISAPSLPVFRARSVFLQAQRLGAIVHHRG